MTEAQVEAQLAAATLHLLKTAQLTGSQVPDFVQIHNWLQAKIDSAKDKTNDKDNPDDQHP